MSDFDRATARTEKFGEWLIMYQPDSHFVSFVITPWEEFSINGAPYELNRVLESDIVGHVKWDGCSNWRTEGPNYALHFCGPEGLDAFAALLKRCYRLTQEHCPNFDSPIADLPETEGLPIVEEDAA